LSAIAAFGSVSRIEEIAPLPLQLLCSRQMLAEGDTAVTPVMTHDKIVSGICKVRQEARIGGAIEQAERDRLITFAVNHEMMYHDFAGEAKLGSVLRTHRRRYGKLLMLPEEDDVELATTDVKAV
jgi:hypothetical protein